MPQFPSFPLSVLFIPFDANGSHLKRNAERGVKGTITHEGREIGKTGVAAPGPAMATTGYVPLDEIVSEACLKAAIAINPALHVSHPDAGTPGHTAASQLRFDQWKWRCAPSLSPDLIFLSEEPRSLPFPAEFEVTLGIQSVRYERIEIVEGPEVPPVQRMAAYYKVDMTRHVVWNAEWTQKDFKGTTEHVLVASHIRRGASYKIAGMHLTSKNTAAKSESARAAILDALQSFCDERRISVAVGDFNTDVRACDGGTVGTAMRIVVGGAVHCKACGPAGKMSNGACMRCNGTAKTAENIEAQVNQFSDSVNKAHYMGMVAFGASTTRDHSLPRTLRGTYFSDHPPIFAVLDFGEQAIAERREFPFRWLPLPRSGGQT